MKNLKYFKICFLFALVAMLQIRFVNAQNLVPNPSFEEYISCPSDYGQTFLAGWTININTADYFNSCGEPDFSVPSNCFGYQCPASINCNSYVGFYAVDPFYSSSEYVGAQLTEPLEVGEKYFVTLKISLSNHFATNCGVNKLGTLFTNFNYGNLLEAPPPSVMNNFSQVYTDQCIIVQNQWTSISGSFIADSAYQYIIIGRFFDNNNIILECFDENNPLSYYYIDDVCVSTDSAFCWDYVYNCNSSIEDKIVYKPEFTLSPNPANDNVYVQMENKMFQIVKSVELYTMQGKNVTDKVEILNNDNSGFTIKQNNLNKGIYILKIQTLNKIYCTKLIFN